MELIKKIKLYWLHILISLFAVFTHLWRLDAVSLWRDEATTACWAREISNSSEFSPRVWNGSVLAVQGADAHDFNRHLLPAMQGWLQFYVTALFFKLFGITTFTARLPFALLGLLGVYLLYKIGITIFNSEKMGLLAALLTSVSFPYLLYVRECRYYALSLVSCMLIIFEVIRYIKNNEIGQRVFFYFRLGLWGFLLYFSNYLTFATFWGCLLVFFLINWDKRVFVKFMLTSLVLGAVLSGEFLLLHLDFIADSTVTDKPSIAQYWKYLKRNYIKVNEIIPFYVLAPLGFWAAFKNVRQTPQHSKIFLFLVVSFFLSVVFNVVLAKRQIHVRYYIQVIPIGILVILFIYNQILTSLGKIVGIILLISVMGWQNLTYFDNLNEAVVQQQFAGVDKYNGAIFEFIEKNIKPSETVAIYRNVKGMALYFRFPWLKWVAQLDASSPRTPRYRSVLPDYVFDDTKDVDWYILWDKRKFDMSKVKDYQKVWTYKYIRNKVRKHFWKKRKPRIFQYEVFRRISVDSSQKLAF